MDNSLPAPSLPVLRTGRNHDGYHGETIDLQAVLREMVTVAAKRGWDSELLPAGPERSLLSLNRRSREPARRVYISAGIHGDEPAGPLAACQLIRSDLWPSNCDLWICPCLNPTGFPLNRRESAAGLDLNRDYRDPKTAEVQAHVSWLKRQPDFDLALCLHEDWEAHGFYLYELNPDNRPSRADAMVAAVEAICPIDPSLLIDGREARHGIIRPNLDPQSRPQWPEAFFLIRNKTRQSYTLEAPSDYALPVRVAALVAATRAALGEG